jgi:hypothetical protein
MACAAACGDGGATPAGGSARAALFEPRDPSQVVFRDVTTRTGIEFVHESGMSPKRQIVETLGGGVAVLDFDGDGWPDLYFVDSGEVPERTDVQRPVESRLYRNVGGLRFEDVTARAGLQGRGYGMGAVAGDYDADGDVDLYVTSYGSNALYRNEGEGKFRDVTREAACDDARWSTGAAFLDFDRDGALDLFVENYLDYRVEDYVRHEMKGETSYPPPDLFEPTRCSLFRNRGDGTFEDVSESSGVAAARVKGLGVLVSDLDGDGDPEVYCASDTMPNLLFENLGGGRFREVAMLAGCALSEEGREEAGMGVDAADLDGDQILDIVVTNFFAETNSVYRGEGGLFFTEISARTGTAEAARKSLGFGVRLFDYDNDGTVDMVLANGSVYHNAPRVQPGSTFAQPALCFRGVGGARFEDVGARMDPKLVEPRVRRGLATADFDRDGDLDLVFANLGGPPSVFENVGGDRRAWVSVGVRGTRRDSTAIGTRVTVVAGGRAQVQEVRSGGSYLSQSDLRLTFGLGDAEEIERVEVRWPDGSVEGAEKLRARQHLTFVEGAGLSR